MKSLIIAVLTLLSTTAMASPWLQARVGAGAHFHEDDSFDVVSASPNRPIGSVGFDVRIVSDLWLSADFEGSGRLGQVYLRDVTYSTLSWGLGATWRWSLVPDLDLFARASAVARQVTFEIGEAQGDAWTFAGRGAGGLEYELVQLGQTAAMGARLEFTYERAIPVEVVASSTSLGTFDPSGPGVALGVFWTF